MQAEISQKEIVTLKTTDEVKTGEVIDLRKNNQKSNPKGATLDDILDPDASDEMEVENYLVSPIYSIPSNICTFADVMEELKQEYEFLNPLEEYRDLQPIFNNGKRIYI